MRVRVLAFARIRELLDESGRTLELSEGATIRDAWAALTQRSPAVDEMRSVTRVARNGRIADFDDTLSDGDELALLPPVGGG
jgi:molybdopterin converting factor small subunit